MQCWILNMGLLLNTRQGLYQLICKPSLPCGPLALDGSRPNPALFDRLTGLLGLESRLDCFPHMLSGGGQQYAAIARALMTRPAIILADEPTGSLDAKTGQNVAGLLKMTVDVFHQTLIMITHNPELAQLADHVVCLQNGRVAK